MCTRQRYDHVPDQQLSCFSSRFDENAITKQIRKEEKEQKLSDKKQPNELNCFTYIPQKPY